MLRLLILILLLPYSIHSLSVPSNHRTQLESDAPTSQATAAMLSRWYRVRKAANTEFTQVMIAIKHTSPQRLEELFWTVSDPSSPTYGRFLELSELSEFVVPSPHALHSVTSWLLRYGVDIPHSCAFSPLREFLSCQITVEQAEQLFEVELHVYRNEEEKLGEIIRSPTPCSVDSHVKPYIDFIGGLNHFHSARHVSSRIASVFNKEGHSDAFNSTPSYLRALYNVSGGGEAYLNKQATVEFLGESMSPVDLVDFMAAYAGEFPHFKGVDGILGENNPTNPGLTANLDVQYIMSLGNNVPTWLWLTDGKWHNIEPFLAWIVNVSSMQNRDLPLLFSCGYAEQEALFSREYLDRINQEFMKMGLRGVSLVVTSGDYGAGCQRSKFSPYFPASSPYVTSVGSTQIRQGEETALYISGGGFSDRFRTPSYQEEFTARYLKSGALPNADYFNSRGRGFPDVSALGDNYVVRINGNWEYRVYSTSAATAAVAGMISLLNDKRLMKGDKQFGFLNPLLYKHPEVLRDITGGHNTGCFGGAFSSRDGWDPVTGLGVPLFIQMSEKLV